VRGPPTAAWTERALLAIKGSHGPRLSIGVVLEGAGLLHAKALLVEGPTGASLLVGSANLTRSALGTNHELGVLLGAPPGDVRRAFHQFVTSIAPRSLDGGDAREFLTARGLMTRPSRSGSRSPAPAAESFSALQEVLARLPAVAPLDTPAEEHVAAWIRKGYLVGKGRRSLDALVLRLPQERLIKLGYVVPPQRETLGIASHETRTMGYGVDLIPTQDAEVLRKAARRVSMLLGKLTLNLPCFGMWMPETYWGVFCQARERLQAATSLAQPGSRPS
jgi:hypothetical protein